MIRATYEYVCDRCGSKIRADDSFVAHFMAPIPAPVEVKTALGKHLCAECCVIVAKAIEPKAPVNKVPA